MKWFYFRFCPRVSRGPQLRPFLCLLGRLDVQMFYLHYISGWLTKKSGPLRGTCKRNIKTVNTNHFMLWQANSYSSLETNQRPVPTAAAPSLPSIMHTSGSTLPIKSENTLCYSLCIPVPRAARIWAHFRISKSSFSFQVFSSFCSLCVCVYACICVCVFSVPLVFSHLRTFK